MEEENLRSARGNIKPSQERSRTWSITGWKEPSFNELQMRYLVYGKEICPETQKLHYQTYVYFNNQKTFKQVLKFFPSGDFRVEKSRGDFKENLAYCTKDDDFVEFGDRPSQGKRCDLEDVRDRMIRGETDPDRICVESPMLYHQYGRTLEKLNDIFMRERWERKQMCIGAWYYGPTGVGKSHIAFYDYNPSTHYLYPEDGGWWDAYKQQRTVIFNDFRGSIPYDMMLKLCDKWPVAVRRRGREPIPFTSTMIIVTSSLHPKDIYHNRADNDCIEQLLRRFTVIFCPNKFSEIDERY